MASYQKLTADTFIENLGKYADGGAARKGLGRSKLSEKDKAKCYAAIDKKFGAGGAAPSSGKKKKAKKSGRKGAKKAKAAKKSGKKAAKKAAAPVTKKFTRVKKPVKKTKGAKKAAKKASSELTPFNLVTADALARVHLIGNTVATASEAIKALDHGKKAGGDPVNITEGVQTAANTLTTAMKRLNEVAGSLSNDQLLEHPSTVHSPPGAAESFASVASATPSNGAAQVAPQPPAPPPPPPVPPSQEQPNS